jgi:hypothetical protein
MSISTSRRPPAPERRVTHGGGGGKGPGGGDEGGGGGGGGGGPMVKVAFARNQVEAEMLQGLLSEAGIPSMLKRSGAFDNPEFLAAGPRDVYVAAEAAQRARQVLAETMLEDEGQEQREIEEERRLARGETGLVGPGRLALWLTVAVVGAVILVWLLYQLTS